MTPKFRELYIFYLMPDFMPVDEVGFFAALKLIKRYDKDYAPRV